MIRKCIEKVSWFDNLKKQIQSQRISLTREKVGYGRGKKQRCLWKVYSVNKGIFHEKDDIFGAGAVVQCVNTLA